MDHDTDRRMLLSAAGIAGLAAFAAGARAAGGGPLNPPPGPVSGTSKPLGDVEPRTAVNAANTPGDATSTFKITQPGSYYLTGNLPGDPGKHGIVIASSGVTLDLCGFALVSTTANGPYSGVFAGSAGMSDITVMNGIIGTWGGCGIDLFTNPVTGGRISGVSAAFNTQNGIAAGTGVAVTDCVTHHNGAFGITVGLCCTVTGCTSYSNTSSGMACNSGSVITACSAYLNGANGFVTSPGCRVAGCTAYNNAACGISVNTGSSVVDCDCRLNVTDGILCTTGCLIRGNSCTGNGSTGSGAGIHATFADNRIEENLCTTADRGIDIDSAGNIIVRNCCSGNTTNWDVVSGNVILVVTAATTTASIIGSSGGVAPGSTDPNANFTY